MDWQKLKHHVAETPPLPEGVEVFAEAQTAQQFDEEFLVFSARQTDERDIADPDRRHAFVSVAPQTMLGAERHHRTVVLGMVGSEILLKREVKAPTNRLEVEFAFQEPRIQLAKYQASRRVQKRLHAMQAVTAH